MKLNSNSVINSFQQNLPGLNKKEKEKEFSQEEIKDTVTFAGKGLQAMEGKDNILEAIKEGEAYIKAIAGSNRGSKEARLARIALKASTEGDCSLADMANMESLENLSPLMKQKGIALSDSMKALSLLFKPLEAVYHATLETLSSVSGGAVSLIAAKTGLKAMKSLEKEMNPMSPALAAEPFLIGIAEHSRENEKAGNIADFLQDEITPNLTYPSNAAYRVALEAIANGFSQPETSILARIGSEMINSMPGHEKDIAPLALPVLDKMNDSENPLISEVAGTIHDKANSLLKDEKKDEMFSLLKIGLKELEETFPGSVEETAKAGVKMMDALEKANPPLSNELIAETGEAYLDFIRENTEDQKSQAITEITESIYTDDEEGVTAKALYRSALQSLSSSEPFSLSSYLDIGLNAIKSLEGDKDNSESQVKIARKFIESIYSGYEIPEEIKAVLELPEDSENIAGKHVEILNKLKGSQQ